MEFENAEIAEIQFNSDFQSIQFHYFVHLKLEFPPNLIFSQ